MLFWGVFAALWPLVAALDYAEVSSRVSSDGLLHLREKTWRNDIKNEDYGMYLLITATDPRVGCVLCREFGPTYALTAKAYWDSLQEAPLELASGMPDRAKTVFAIAELNEVKELFQLYNIKQVPRMWYYAPGQGPKLMEPSDRYQFLVEDSDENFHGWVAGQTPGMDKARLAIVRRMSAAGKLGLVLSVCVFSSAVYWQRWAISRVVQSRNLWLLVTLASILVFISGHMFNQIRNSPSVREDADGNTLFFHPAQNMQVGAETKIVFGIYSVIVAVLVALVRFVPALKNAQMAAVGCCVCCVVLTLAYSSLINAYALKSASYPFKLFKLT